MTAFAAEGVAKKVAAKKAASTAAKKPAVKTVNKAPAKATSHRAGATTAPSTTRKSGGAHAVDKSVQRSADIAQVKDKAGAAAGATTDAAVSVGKKAMNYNKVLAVEFMVGLFLVLTTKTDSNTHSVVLQAVAFIFVWVILFFVTAAGAGAAKFAAALGGLILMTLLMKNGTIIAKIFNVGGTAADVNPNPDWHEQALEGQDASSVAQDTES